MARSYRQICPIAQTLDIIGERWTILVLRELSFGTTRFSELQQHLPGIPARVLSERLKKLEGHELIERRVYSEHPLRAEYHLTELGNSLVPVVGAIAKWGMEYRLTKAQRQSVLDHVPAHIRPYLV